MTVSEDFTDLTGRFRGELLAHCYRMLGSAEEAEDLVQETYLRAWRSFEGFEGRSSMRTWLYRIATNVCLTAIEHRGRRPLPSGLGGPAEDPRAPLVAGAEVPWLQPFPGPPQAGDHEDPAAVMVSRAGIRLALVAALQHLSARQRAVLILRDVLEWPAAQVADLLTGANRGIGRALAEEALCRGARRVYAGTRQPFSHPDERVTPLSLDVTSLAQIQAAAAQVESLDILVNNAGIALYDDLSDRAVIQQHLDVNLFGTFSVTEAFLPLLTRSGGAIVNNVSMMAHAPFPLTPAYAISKAAAFNMTQSLRALLAGRGVWVHAALTGPTDTDMTRGFDIPKVSPQSVARAIFDGIDNGEEDIFPDPASQGMAGSWRGSVAKSLERQYRAFVQDQPAVA